jgi:hypothetical protein
MPRQTISPCSALINNSGTNDFSGWTIGGNMRTAFGKAATLTATAYLPNSADFSDWQIGAMTDGKMGTAFGGRATANFSTLHISPMETMLNWEANFGTADDRPPSQSE